MGGASSRSPSISPPDVEIKHMRDFEQECRNGFAACLASTGKIPKEFAIAAAKGLYLTSMRTQAEGMHVSFTFFSSAPLPRKVTCPEGRQR